MTQKPRRAPRFRHIPSFVVALFLAANLAHAASPDLSFSPATLDFKYQAGAALPASQTLQIKSTGNALGFTISPPAAQWLTLSAASGTTSASIKVYVNPTSLPSGSYQATLVVNAPAAATPAQNYVVTLEVSSAPPTLTVSPSTLAFTYATDQASAPAAKSLVLTSSGGAVSTTITASGGTWLSVSPAGTIPIIGIPSTILVTVNPAGLAPGTYTGTIKVIPALAGIPTTTVGVSLQVSAGVPVVTGLWPPGALINSPNTIVTVQGQNFFSTSTAAIGNTKLPNPTVISSAALLITIPASLMTAAGGLPITISTPTAISSSSTTAASTFQVYVPGPQVMAVTDGASYATGKISPGEIITIYGLGLGPATLTALTVADPLATSLPAGAGGTTVTIDGVSAPLLYTSANVVSCIVPFSVAAKSGSQVNLSVTYNSIAAAAPTKVSVVDTNPGLFTMDSSGSGQGAILNYSPATGAYSLNGTSNPAIKGSTIAVLYLTGYGLTNCVDISASSSNPASACNLAATEANLISGAVTPKVPVSVTIDGHPAPGAVAQAPLGSVPGLMQVNVPVPATAKTGNVPVLVTLGSGAAQSSSQLKVTMAVK